MRCSQRCSQRVFVLKTKAPQVADLRRQVELEGIEPSTSSMPSMVRIDQQGCRSARSVVVVEVNGHTIEPGANLNWIRGKIDLEPAYSQVGGLITHLSD